LEQDDVQQALAFAAANLEDRATETRCLTGGAQMRMVLDPRRRF
jgi:hypothetical protein